MSSHDRFEPKLRVASSGYEGSGYKLPTRGGQVVPGVTTVLGILDKPGVVQWAVNNTAAYAVANIDSLLTRSETQGYGFLRFYHSRFKEQDFDNPEIDIYNYSNGVLSDLGELGTVTHDWVASNVLDEFEPDLVRDEQVQMVEKFLEWRQGHVIEPIVVEGTVVGHNYAGTLDHLWEVECIHEGPPCVAEGPTRMLIDAKTSRKTRHEHIAQLAALGAADTLMVETTEGNGELFTSKKWGKTYWREEPLPAFSEYAILHLRPNDIDTKGNKTDSFVKLKAVSHKHIDAGWEMFQGALQAQYGRKALKKMEEI